MTAASPLSDASAPTPSVAVVGHSEWVTFCAGEMPDRGQIALLDGGESMAGGAGASVAVALARLGAQTAFLTGVGGDAAADAVRVTLAAEGVTLHVDEQDGRQTRALSVVDAEGERTILVMDPILVPRGGAGEGWRAIAEADACCVLCGDAEALRAARTAPLMVVIARWQDELRRAGVVADVVVGSRGDVDEAIAETGLELAHAVVETDGRNGGRWWTRSGDEGRWSSVALDGPPVDAYAAGDHFLAGLTYALARGDRLGDAVQAGARLGAVAVRSRGPFADLRGVAI